MRHVAFGIGPHDAATNLDRFCQRGNDQLEHELSADFQWLLCFDEGATLRDVLRIISEERVHFLVFDLELDGSPQMFASVFGPVAHKSLFNIRTAAPIVNFNLLVRRTSPHPWLHTVT